MNNKLYYLDSYKTEFPSEILKIGTDEVGDFALLSESYFYPESGGQPSDNGQINDIHLINEAIISFVKEVDGDTRHYYTGEIELGPALCRINWENRFDYMQQHTGQHILSAIFYNVLKGETSSFTIGEKSSSIEISINDFDEHIALEIMKLSNQIIMKNIEVKSGIYEKSEIEKMPLRKIPSVNENIRIISIDPLDYSPCGGTHSKWTGEVGHIRITGWDKMKNAYRIHFVCGDRSLAESLHTQMILKKTSALLSVNQDDISDSVDRMQQNLRAKNKEIELLSKQICALESQNIFNDFVKKTGDSNLPIVIGFTNKTFEELKLLGHEIARLGSPLVVLYLDDPSVAEDGQIKIVINISESNEENAGKLGKALFEKYGGKGGGGSKASQGSIQRKYLSAFLTEVNN